MSKHTPGPWKASGVGTVSHATRGFWIARLWVGFRTKEREANARLIAAAPDMLAALEDLTVAAPNDPCWQRARAAIAKAKGETA